MHTLPSRQVAIAISIAMLVLGGCDTASTRRVDSQGALLQAQSPSAPGLAMPAPGDIKFKDDVTSNAEVPVDLRQLSFVDTNGGEFKLASFIGQKNVVLVFTEGFAGGMLCPFCKTQTSRLVANYDKFQQLNAEVLVVYPGPTDHLDDFIAAAKTTEKNQVDQVPFPLVLDEELNAASYFRIKSNLAHPSTFVIDIQGNVRLAYVGADMTADRPSIKAMLSVLESVSES